MSEPVNPEGMRQYAPFPDDLADLVKALRFKPGWRFTLADIERDPATSHGAAAGGLTFTVLTSGYDAYHPERGEGYRVYHHFPVPAATFNRASWQRWLLDCLLRVELHETCEFFALEVRCCDRWPDNHAPGCLGPFQPTRPFAPTHGPGDDPYVVHEYADETQRRTRFTGELLDA
jgi:hypothetical protein